MSSKKYSRKGFTILELLITIAIIGLLSAVIMASVTVARRRGTDSAITSIMVSMRTQAALYYSAAGNYASVAVAPATSAGQCTIANTMFVAGAMPNLRSLLVDLAQKNGAILGIMTPGGKNIVCSTTNAPATVWAIVASTSDSTVDWCVDSSGASRAVSGSGEIGLATGLCK